jgi:hemolysin activation/secretion protein
VTINHPTLIAQVRPFLPQPLINPAKPFSPRLAPLPASPEFSPAPNPAAPQPEIEPGTVTVNQFRFVGNRVFSSAELAKVTAPFTHRQLTFAELQQARDAVQKFYTDRGYYASGVLAIQVVRQGIVTLQILEGKLERIDISGDGSRRSEERASRLANYVRSRLSATARPVFNYTRLSETLRLLQLDPRFKTISVTVLPGTLQNTRILDVRLVVNPSFDVQIGLNNQQSPLIGSFERRIQVNHSNLLGLGDQFSVAYGNTAGSNTVSAGYTVPLNARNGTLQLDYGRSDSRIIRQPFAQADIRSSANFYDLTLRQPIVQRATEHRIEELALGFTASRSDLQNSILGIPFPLSPGSDPQGQTHVSAIRLFQEYTQRNDLSIFAARSQFSLGLDAFNSTINRTAPDSRFFAWRGQVQWLTSLNPKLDLRLRSDLQLSDRPLVPTEQFVLGGTATVRGYAQNTLLADNGVVGSAELGFHIFRNVTHDIQLIPFADIGTVWNNSRNPLNNNTLAAVGLGIQWIHQGFQVRANYAMPLISVPNQGESLQEKGFDFSLRYNVSF